MARRRKKRLMMKSGLDLRRKDHTVCEVKFEDSYGHLQRTKIRIPFRIPVNNRNIIRLVENKSGKHVAHIFGETCTTARRSKSHRLPR